MKDYIMESIKNILGENSIGWRKVEKNQKVLIELKDWLQKKVKSTENNKQENDVIRTVLQKIEELEKNV